MATDTVSGNAAEARPNPEHEELNRLMQLYRLASLNQRYYGCRAEKYERRVKCLEIAGGTAAALALGVLMLFSGSSAPVMAWWCVGILTGVAALCTAILPLTQWSAKAKQFSQLHGSYGHAFSDIGSVISNVRRNGCSAECIGASKLVHEGMRRLHSLDELQPDQKLVDQETVKVNEAFPNDYVWTNF
jgi:hypothetical protein